MMDRKSFPQFGNDIYGEMEKKRIDFSNKRAVSVRVKDLL